MKQDSRQITVSEMAPHVHSFKYGENKVNKIAAWLSEWIKTSLKLKKIKPYDFLPSKGDLAFHIGVSLGTMQNVFRAVEDSGLIESKQRIGTYIRNNQEDKTIEKLTSKRDVASETIKKYILDNNLTEDKILTPIRDLAKITGMSGATIRLACNYLLKQGILKKVNKNFVISKIDFEINNIKTNTLAEKVANHIKKSILKNFQEGEKIPSNTELANQYKVSIKTIHDAIKILIKEGIITTKRGRYGTVVSGENLKNEIYDYEKIEIKIKNYINKNCEIGDKLPSIKDFSKNYKTSPKTIKKALDNLLEDGYIRSLRGRYGGTFVTNIPSSNEGYKWIALDPNYMEN